METMALALNQHQPKLISQVEIIQKIMKVKTKVNPMITYRVSMLGKLNYITLKMLTVKRESMGRFRIIMGISLI